MSTSRDCMGASDATVGDVNPNNASAIIALQQADEQPLELQKQNFHGFVEQMARIIADVMRAFYGKRTVMMNSTVVDEYGNEQSKLQPTQFDFSSLDELQMTMRVDVGASSLYSEQLQVQTASNLFTTGIIDDPAKLAIYLKIMPDKYIPNKQILQQYCEELLKQTMAATMPQASPAGGFDPTLQQDDVNVTAVQPRIENTMNAQP
jgi:predicted nucleic acid-binding protein